MKKYTPEQLLNIKRQIMANLDDAIDVLSDLEATERVRKIGKSEIVSEMIFYENEAISDYKKKPYEFFVFLHYFWLKLTPSGKVLLAKKRDVKELSANTYKELRKKIYDFVDETDGELPEDALNEKNWYPKELIEKKKALSFVAPKNK